MLNKLKSYFNIGTNLYGIEIFHEDNTPVYQLIHVQKVKQELEVVADKRFDNWEALEQSTDKKIPVCLTINSEEILDKIVSKLTAEDYKSLVEHSFPSLDFERFYFNVATFKNSNYLAIIEKNSVAELLEKFKSAGISILSFNVGLSSLSHLLPYLNEKNISTNTAELNFTKDTPSLIKNSDGAANTLYAINGLKIQHTSLVSFGSVLQQLGVSTVTHTNYENTATSLKKEFKYVRNFQVLLWPIIGFFLALLLINFFVFNHYYEQQQAIELEQSSNTTNKERLIQLKEDVARKEKRVEAILSNTNSKSTLYLDAIGQTLPNTISLERINYQPLTKPIQSTKEIEQNFKEILISGETGNSEDLSYWISILEKLDWVTQVETLTYSYKNSRSSFFSLKLSINE